MTCSAILFVSSKPLKQTLTFMSSHNQTSKKKQLRAWKRIMLDCFCWYTERKKAAIKNDIGVLMHLTRNTHVFGKECKLLLTARKITADLNTSWSGLLLKKVLLVLGVLRSVKILRWFSYIYFRTWCINKKISYLFKL